jgi:TolA-binding protein
MNSKNLLLGIALIVTGIALFAAYDQFIRPEREAREILAEGKIIMERGDRDSANLALSSFTKVVVKYSATRSAPEAYLQMGTAYEKLGLYRLASLRYSYLLKQPLADRTDSAMKTDVIARLAKLKLMRSYTEEGLNQLYTLLNTTQNGELRSRIYSELGQNYLKNGDVAKAKNSFDIAVQENSSNEDALLGKARVFVRNGNYEEAFQIYDYFLKYFGAVSPYTPDVKSAYQQQLYHAGLYAYRAGNYGRAVELFSRYTYKFSGSKYTENALYWIGESYFSTKQYEKAISWFDKTLSNDFYHKDEDARIKKGYTCFMMKRFDLAAKEFQTYIHDYPHGKYVDEARSWKENSAQELRVRIEKARLPETEEAELDQEVEPAKEQPQKVRAKERIAPERKHSADTSKTDEPETAKDTDNSGKEPTADNTHGDEEVAGVAGKPGVELDNVMEL